MNTNNKSVYRITFVMLLMIFPIAAFAKFYQYNFTGGNNFGIMNYMLDGIYNGTNITFKSYTFPIKIYSLFSFIGFKTNLEWSIFYTTIFTVIIFIFLLKYKKYSLKEYIFIYASMFILAWTVMNMNKDLIQLMFLLIVYTVCSTKKLNNNSKILYSSIIFILESLVFREYYILVAGLSVIVYFIISRQLNNKNKKENNYIKDLILIFLIFFIGIFIAQFVVPSAYDQLVNRRDHLDLIETVNTIIVNLVPGEGYGNFVINYIINFFRICFPIELIIYGLKHSIFFIYQIMITFSLIKSLKKINENNIVYVSIIIAYTLMLVASESDFGTLVRHQSVLLMFYIAMFQNMPRKELNNENKKN